MSGRPKQRFFDLLGTNLCMSFCTLLLYHAIPLIIFIVQAACSTSRRTTQHTAAITAPKPRITRPIPSSSPPRRTDRPRRRGERRWGCDTTASPGTASFGRRGSVRPHHAGSRRQSGAIANSGRADVASRGQGVGHTHPRLQDFSPLLSSAKLACAGGYTHIEIFHAYISETV
jgi:hypothetical protein